MEWNGGRAFQGEVDANVNRVLTTTSGNSQLFSSHPKQNAYDHSLVIPDDQWQPRSQRPLPHSAVPSSDLRTHHRRQRLNARRLKKRARLAEQYLQHPRFLAYKARPRKDTDKDTGEIIWCDETETAFQNAIINIPAMGRHKKSQHRKLCGRNELIMEWIKQETGKTRDRKQVSSHRQTLDKIFAKKPEEGFPGVPEWAAINKVPTESTSDPDEPEFYENSIADMVRDWRMMQSGISNKSVDQKMIVVSQPVKQNMDSTSSKTVTSLDFAMWVSHPDNLKVPLHRYTRVQSNQTMAAPEPLENIDGWRSSWPALATRLEQSSCDDKLDVVLLEASFDLMLDFPPPGSKLATSLEINYVSAGSHNTTGATSSWFCNTEIYHRGKLEMRVEHDECHVPGPGKVKPPFESRWWAEQFTRLTEKHLRALDSGSDATVAATGEAARNYFNNLKIIQLVSMTSEASDTHSAGDRRNTRPHMGGTVALLWSFSQAASNFVGTTTWRRMIIPPPRITTNSPMPLQQGLVLPPLAIDTRIDMVFDKTDTLSDNGFFNPQFEHAADSYLPMSDEEVCQGGFMMIPQHNPYLPIGTSYKDSDFIYQNYNAYEPTALQVDPQELYDTVRMSRDSRQQYQHRLSELQQYQLPTVVHHQAPTLPHLNSSVDNNNGIESRDRSQALRSFDLNTSRMLQAQLEDHHGSGNIHYSHSEPPPEHYYTNQSAQHLLPLMQSDYINPEREALKRDVIPNVSQFSEQCTNVEHMGMHEAECQQYLEPVDQDDPQKQISITVPSVSEDFQIPEIISPKAVRPLLHHYHTFTGILPTGSNGSTFNHDELTVRQDFTRLLDGLNDNHEGLFDQDGNMLPHLLNYSPGTDDETDLIVGLGITRPHSQPLPIVQGSRPPVVSNDVVLELIQQHGQSKVEQAELPLVNTEPAPQIELEAGQQTGIDVDWVDVKLEEI